MLSTAYQPGEEVVPYNSPPHSMHGPWDRPRQDDNPLARQPSQLRRHPGCTRWAAFTRARTTSSISSKTEPWSSPPAIKLAVDSLQTIQFVIKREKTVPVAVTPVSTPNLPQALPCHRAERLGSAYSIMTSTPPPRRPRQCIVQADHLDPRPLSHWACMSIVQPYLIKQEETKLFDSLIQIVVDQQVPREQHGQQPVGQRQWQQHRALDVELLQN